MPAAKTSKTKWIGYRGTLTEHTAIKTAAARRGVTVGTYLRLAEQLLRKNVKPAGN